MKYKLEIDQLTKEEFNRTIGLFEDSNLYQTWEYNEHARGGKKTIRFVLKEDKEIIGVGTIRIINIPFLPVGIAYTYRGPLWRRKNLENSVEIFKELLSQLKNEFVLRRKLILRLAPNILQEESINIKKIFSDLGFLSIGESPGQKTFYIDLSPSIEDLRKQLSGNWRKKLKKAENSGLSIITGTDENLFLKFLPMYHEMLKRKKYKLGIEIEKLQLVQYDLPKEHKMIITLCYKDNTLVSGLIFSAIGNTGIPILAATSDFGTEFNGAYLLHWNMLVYLKENGFRYFDLGGIDKLKNPKVYNFKHGLRGREVEYMNLMQVGHNKTSIAIINHIESFKEWMMALKSLIHIKFR